MTSKPTIKDIKVAKKELDKEMIKGLLEYVRNGVFPNNSPNSYMNAYTIVHSMADQGDEQSSELFKYHNDTIQGFVDDCYKIISKESSNQLIDKFISVTENINFLIYWMNRIFTYLDRFYTKAKSKQTLCQNAMNSYKEHLFDKIQNNIYIEVNKLIKEDRNCNIESRPKIKTILKILYDIDLSSPKIIREKNKISWVQDTQGNENKKETPYQDKWFEEYFKTETIKFAKGKAKADIHNMSAPEYIISQLKYLDEEEIRQREYINPKYIEKINEINRRLLIGENAQEL